MFDGPVVQIGTGGVIDVDHLNLFREIIDPRSSTYSFEEADPEVIISDDIPSVITIEDNTINTNPILHLSGLGTGTVITPPSTIIAHFNYIGTAFVDAIITVPPSTTIKNLDPDNPLIELDESLKDKPHAAFSINRKGLDDHSSVLQLLSKLISHHVQKTHSRPQ